MNKMNEIRDAYELFYSHSNFRYKDREIIGVFFDIEKAKHIMLEKKLNSNDKGKIILSKIKVIKYENKWCRVLTTGMNITE